MPGIRHQEQTTPIDFIEDFLNDEIEEASQKLEASQKSEAKKSKRSNGEYFRKIEELLEKKQLHDNLSDYEWDD